MSTQATSISSPRSSRDSLISSRLPFFYGWMMLPLAMLALAASAPGQTYGVMIFNEAIRTNLGLSHSQLALAYTLGTIIGSIPISLFGWAMDRYGIRRTMLCMIALFSLACFVVAQASNWFMLLLGFTMLRMLGPGALAFISGNTLAYWFERKLGTVEGIRSTGTALSMMVTPVIGLWLLHEFGWRNAYIFFGVGISGLLLPLFWFLFRNRPEEFGRGLDGVIQGSEEERHQTRLAREKSDRDDFTLGEAMRTFPFWIIASGKSMYALVQTALFFSLVPILQGQGFTASDAATLTTVFGTTLIVMQLCGGYLADRFPATILMCIGLLCFSLGLSLVTFSTATWMIALAGFVLGSAQGTFFGAMQPVWARYYGRKHLGKIRGFLMTMMVASSSLGPLFAGLMHDAFGNFQGALYCFLLAPLPLAMLTLSATKPVKKIVPAVENQLAFDPA